MKAIKFKESDFYSIKLRRGHYLIDDQYLSIDEYEANVQVKDINKVIPTTRKDIIHFYTDSNNNVLTVNQYIDEKQKLIQDNLDENGDIIWKSLEDEFKYKKFLQIWNPIYKSVEIKGDPYNFEIINSQINTNNKFINSDYINGGDNPLLFIYDRPTAVKNIVKEKFTSLGMVFEKGINYASTKNKKIWGNSEHSCIEYVTAFNKYIFSRDWKNLHIIKGDLDKLLEYYNNDKTTLESVIQTEYNVHFGKIETNEFDFEELLNQLNNCQNILNYIEAKSKSYQDLNTLKNRLGNSIYFIKNSYKTLNNES